MKLAWKSAAAFAVAAIAATAAGAQEKVPYPADTVTLVTHSSPGGGTDVFLREMVNHLGKYIDANFVVENVRGGSGAKAMAHLAAADTDGSILYGTTPTYINTSLLSKPEKTYADLEPRRQHLPRPADRLRPQGQPLQDARGAHRSRQGRAGQDEVRRNHAGFPRPAGDGAVQGSDRHRRPGHHP